MISLYNLNVIFGFIIFAPLTESFNVLVVDRQGHMGELQKPIHIDVENTPKEMRARLEKQFEDFLHKSKKHNPNNAKRDEMRSKLDSSILGNNSSPVVYSNGRYTLDFDNIDIREVKVVTSKPDIGASFDPSDNFRDYYDFVNERLRSPPRSKYYSKNIRSKDFIFRKHNELLLGGKKFRSGNSDSTEEVKRTYNRFKIIGNDKKKNKHKKSPHKTSKKIKYSSEDSPELKEESFENLSAEEPKKYKKKIVSEEVESDDDFYYLQGNELLKLKSKDADSDAEGNDGRRRLPHFMPKRFHWSPKEIKHLGYFWFNGPKGKYPEATPLN